MLVEEEHAPGRPPALGRQAELGPRPAVCAPRSPAEPGIEVLTDSVVTGRYDDNWIAVVQRNLPGVHRAPDQGAGRRAGRRRRTDRAAVRLRRQRPARGDALHRGAQADQSVRRPARDARPSFYRQREGDAAAGPDGPASKSSGPVDARRGRGCCGPADGHASRRWNLLRRHVNRVRSAGHRDRLDRTDFATEHGR